MLIFSRSNYIVIASGIVSLRKQLLSAPVNAQFIYSIIIYIKL